jgi:hypothetical protein
MKYLLFCCCGVFISACASYKYYDFSSLRPERYDLKMSISVNDKKIFSKEITTDSLFMIEDSLKIMYDSLSGIIPVLINIEGSWQSAKPIYRIIYEFDNWQGEILFNNRETGASVVKDKIYIGDINKTKISTHKPGEKDIVLPPKQKYAVRIGVGL